MANLLFDTRESDSLRSENPKMSQPSRGLVEVAQLAIDPAAADDHSGPGGLCARKRKPYRPRCGSSAAMQPPWGAAKQTGAAAGQDTSGTNRARGGKR